MGRIIPTSQNFSKVQQNKRHKALSQRLAKDRLKIQKPLFLGLTFVCTLWTKHKELIKVRETPQGGGSEKTG